jgi:glucose/arabinose dehydrogenase
MRALVNPALLSLAAAFMAAPAPAFAQASATVETSSGPVRIETIAQGLQHPWGLALLPDGRMLVTERPGRLRVVTPKGQISAPLKGVPNVYAQRQGGLLDVALSPDFARDRLVYLTFSEPGEGGAGTALARGRLNAEATALENTSTIFSQRPKVSGGAHFGSRIVFARDGAIFLTTGDRGKLDPSQDNSNHIGVVVRIDREGRPMKDNPFVGRQGALPEIWSYGHRNAQGAALNPRTGELWLHEMGPRAGDEINIARAGRNYGWPLVSWGDHYDGRPIPKPPTRPDLADAVHHWKGTVAPSGMAFYDGDLFPKWRGSLLVGGLVARAVLRMTLEGERVTGEERIPVGARVRDVRVGPDGAIYALTDSSNGALLRIAPAR